MGGLERSEGWTLRLMRGAGGGKGIAGSGWLSSKTPPDMRKSRMAVCRDDGVLSCSLRVSHQVSRSSSNFAAIDERIQYVSMAITSLFFFFF